MVYLVERGGWLPFKEREAYLNELKEEQTLLLEVIKSPIATMADIDRFEYLRKEYARVARVHRGEHDVLYFGMTYFAEDANPDNPDNLIPAGVGVHNAADFHRILCELFDDIATGKQKEHVAYGCPRSHGKTAWISNIFLTHQVVYRHRRYIVLFSETTDVAGDFISWSKFQLKLNLLLREDFGELLQIRPTMNELDNKYEYITSSGTKVEAKGLGTQTRGLRHGASRPDLFILDDLESKDSTNTPELIEKSKRWFREEMLPAMSKTGLCVYLGTILCYGSLLHYVINERRDFKSRLFGAVKTFASNEELWNTWRNIYREDSEDAPQRAREFFEENKDAMLDGTSVLWEEMWNYYDLMRIREESGIKAFNQEYLNNPTDEERQIFKPEYFIFFNDAEIAEKNLTYYAGIDIAMGKQSGDYSAIATIAKNEDTGVCYLIDVYMERLHPDKLVKKAVELTLRYQYERIGIETQFIQELVADNLASELQAKGYPGHTRLKHIKQRTRKQIRIESLLPDVQNGKLRFHEKLKNSLDQFEMFPMHPNDDFPDAVQMAYDTAKSGAAVVRTVRTADRWKSRR